MTSSISIPSLLPILRSFRLFIVVWFITVMLAFSDTTFIRGGGSSSNGVPSTTQQIFSPIRHFEPSWTASSAQGTAVAISCSLLFGEKHDVNPTVTDCIALVIRATTPKSPLQYHHNTPNKKDDDERQRQKEGLLLSSSFSNLQAETSFILRKCSILSSITTPNTVSFVQERKRQRKTRTGGCYWKPIGDSYAATAICAMTGFVADVEHLVRVIQKYADQHQFVYDFPQSTVDIVRNLATAVREPTQYQGARPYGIQGLIIGGNDMLNLANTKERQVSVYTVDLTGGWRHWVSGTTAIGRNAEQIRKQLYDLLVSKHDELKQGQSAIKEHNQKDGTSTNDNHEKIIKSKDHHDLTKKIGPMQAIRIAIKAIVKSTKIEMVNQESDEYEVVLFWLDSKCNGCLAVVDPSLVQHYYDVVLREVDDDGQNRNRQI